MSPFIWSELYKRIDKIKFVCKNAEVKSLDAFFKRKILNLLKTNQWEKD